MFENICQKPVFKLSTNYFVDNIPTKILVSNIFIKIFVNNLNIIYIYIYIE